MVKIIPTSSPTDLAEKLVGLIKENNSKTDLLINISGCTGAGKTTWAELITQALEASGSTVSHVSEDDFLQPRGYRENLKTKTYRSGEWEGKTYWYNHDNWLRLDLMKKVITNLSVGKSTTYYPYLRKTGNFAIEAKTVRPADIVVFETSIFSELFDVVILIDVEDSVLLDRKLHRDDDLRDEATIRAYHQVQLAFWKKHKPPKSTFVIDNNDYKNPVLMQGLVE